MALALHSTLASMAQSDKAERDRIATRLAPLTSALGAPAEPAALTVSEAAREWLEDVKPVSARRYAMVLRRFREAIGDPAITSVTPQIAGQFRDAIKGMPALAGLPGKPGLPDAIRKASVPMQLAWRKDNPEHPAILPGAIENHLSAMRSLYSWCMKPERGYVTANPFDGIEARDDPRGKDSHHHAALPYADMPAFMAELVKHDRPAAKQMDSLRALRRDLYVHKQAIDTTTPAGKAMFGMCVVFAEFEREIIRERINAGIARARVKGTKSGRQIGRAPVPQATVDTVRVALAQPGATVRSVAKATGLSTAKVGNIRKAA